MFVLLALCFILFVVRRCWQGPWATLQCVDENVLSSSLCPKHTTALITSGQYSTVLFVFLKVIFWLLLFISELILQLLWLADI